MTFREKVNALRIARKLSYEEMAEGIGHENKSRIQGWLGPNEAAPRLDDAMRVARLFNVPLEYLADDSIESLPEPDKPTECRKHIDMMLEVLGDAESLRRLKGAPGADVPLSPVGNPSSPLGRSASR